MGVWVCVCFFCTCYSRDYCICACLFFVLEGGLPPPQPSSVHRRACFYGCLCCGSLGKSASAPPVLSLTVLLVWDWLIINYYLVSSLCFQAILVFIFGGICIIYVCTMSFVQLYLLLFILLVMVIPVAVTNIHDDD